MSQQFRVLVVDESAPAGINSLDLEVRAEASVPREVMEAALADAVRRMLAAAYPPHFDDLPTAARVATE